MIPVPVEAEKNTRNATADESVLPSLPHRGYPDPMEKIHKMGLQDNVPGDVEAISERRLRSLSRARRLLRLSGARNDDFVLI